MRRSLTENFFSQTISSLLRPDLRSKLGRNQHAVRSAEPFLLHAAASLTHHLRQAATTSEGMMNQLVKFLKGPSVLTWVHSLALFSQLEVSVTTARVFNWFSGLNGKLKIERKPITPPPTSLGVV